VTTDSHGHESALAKRENWKKARFPSRCRQSPSGGGRIWPGPNHFRPEVRANKRTSAASLFSHDIACDIDTAVERRTYTRTVLWNHLSCALLILRWLLAASSATYKLLATEASHCDTASVTVFRRCESLYSLTARITAAKLEGRCSTSDLDSERGRVLPRPLFRREQGVDRIPSNLWLTRPQGRFCRWAARASCLVLVPYMSIIIPHAGTDPRIITEREVPPRSLTR
jgi:hypothetical protein